MAAKLRIFANQGNDDIAVVPRPTSPSRTSAAAPAGCRSAAAPGAELSERAGELWWDERAADRVDEIACPGAHNRAERDGGRGGRAWRAGSSREAVADGAATFAGRRATASSVIADRDGVAYVNDSKATNVASTLVALRGVPGRRST